MLKLSVRSEYALLLVKYLLDFPDVRHSLSKVANVLHLSETLLRKTTTDLIRAGLCTSYKGRAGGIQIQKHEIMVYEVLSAMHEDLSLALCTESTGCKEESSCRVSPTLKRIQRGMEALLKVTKI